MYAKNPKTNEVEKVAHWDSSGGNYSVGFADGTRITITPSEIYENPQFEKGDLVNRMLRRNHPDPTRMEGKVNNVYWEEQEWVYEIIWNIWNLEDPEANRLESWTATNLEKASNKYTVPRFLVGERVNIQALGVVTRNHKILSYSHWEAPPANDFGKKDRGWWVNIQFDAGPGEAAERQMWNEENPPLDPESIIDNPDGITTYLGNDRDTVFVISNAERDRQGNPMPVGKLSQGVQLDKLTIDDYQVQPIVGGTPEKLRNLGIRLRTRGSVNNSWQSDNNELFDIGEREPLLGEIAQEAGPALEEAGAIAVGTGWTMAEFAAGAGAVLGGVASVLATGGLVLVGVGIVGLVAYLSQPDILKPDVNDQIRNTLKHQDVWVFVVTPGDPAAVPKWWKGKVTHTASALQQGLITVYVNYTINKNKSFDVGIDNMLNLKIGTDHPETMREWKYMYDKETAQGLRKQARNWDIFDNKIIRQKEIAPDVHSLASTMFIVNDNVLLDGGGNIMTIKSVKPGSPSLYTLFDEVTGKTYKDVDENRLQNPPMATNLIKDTDDIYLFKIADTGQTFSKKAVRFTHPSEQYAFIFDFDAKTMYIKFYYPDYKSVRRRLAIPRGGNYRRKQGWLDYAAEKIQHIPWDDLKDINKYEQNVKYYWDQLTKCAKEYSPYEDFVFDLATLAFVHLVGPFLVRMQINELKRTYNLGVKGIKMAFGFVTWLIGWHTAPFATPPDLHQSDMVTIGTMTQMKYTTDATTQSIGARLQDATAQAVQSMKDAATQAIQTAAQLTIQSQAGIQINPVMTFEDYTGDDTHSELSYLSHVSAELSELGADTDYSPYEALNIVDSGMQTEALTYDVMTQTQPQVMQGAQVQTHQIFSMMARVMRAFGYHTTSMNEDSSEEAEIAGTLAALFWQSSFTNPVIAATTGQAKELLFYSTAMFLQCISYIPGYAAFFVPGEIVGYSTVVCGLVLHELYKYLLGEDNTIEVALEELAITSMDGTGRENSLAQGLMSILPSAKKLFDDTQEAVITQTQSAVKVGKDWWFSESWLERNINKLGKTVQEATAKGSSILVGAVAVGIAVYFLYN